MSTRAKVQAAVNAIPGATMTVDTINGVTAIGIDAPDGMVWRCTGDIHSLIAEYQSFNDATVRCNLWASLLIDVAQGVERCEIPDCDNCQTEEAFNCPP